MIATGSNDFEMFGTSHLVVMALTLIVPVVLAVACARGRRAKTTRSICWGLALLLLVNEIAIYIHGLHTHTSAAFMKTKLPLHLCGVGLYLTVTMLIRPRQLLYEVAFFWGLAGTLNAIITPDIDAGFPSYAFMQFFVTHSGIVVAVLFATWGMRMRPRLRGGLYAWLLANALAAVVGLINFMNREAKWNYMFLRNKPEGAAGNSPFFFAEWPRYILVLELVALVMFAILYAPFPVCDKLRARRRGKRDEPLASTTSEASDPESETSSSNQV